MSDQPETRRAIGSAWCELYHCEAHFFIEQWPDGTRTLLVEYGEGYDGPWLPLAANGQREFSAGIPSDRTDDEVIALLLTPPVISDEQARRIIKPPGDPAEYLRNFPTWETGARAFGSPYLAWPRVLRVVGGTEQ